MEAIRNLVLQPEEEQKIRVALQAIFDNPKNKIVHTFSDIETAMSAMRDFVRNGEVIFFYDGNRFIGIVIYDVVNYWWSDKRFLMEVMILCVEPKCAGFGRIGVSILEDLAKEYNCVAINSGCIVESNKSIVTNMYKKAGYSFDVPTFIKEVKQ